MATCSLVPGAEGRGTMEYLLKGRDEGGELCLQGTEQLLVRVALGVHTDQDQLQERLLPL